MTTLSKPGTCLIALAVLMRGVLPAQKPAAPAATSSQTATVSGTVVSSTGTPLSAILVVNPNTHASLTNLTTTSSSNGSFQFSNVPAGTYQMCITVQSAAYVDPCLWNPGGTLIPIAASQALTGQVIQVQQAAVLHVRINDPQDLRNAAQTNGAPRAIVMGVVAQGNLLLPTSTDATGFDQQVAIPAGTVVPFTIMPIGLSMTDSSGNAVPATGATVSISVPPTSIATPTVLTYNVTAGL